MQRCTHLFPGKALVSADTWLPPAATVLSSHDHSRKAIALEEEQARIQLVQVRQSLAPVLSVSGGATVTPDINRNADSFLDNWQEDKIWNWDIRIAVDISNLFSPELKQSEKLYQLKRESIGAKHAALEEQKTAAREYYAKMITTLEKRKTTTEKSRANWQQKHTDSLELYEKGAGTFLDVQNAYIQTRVKMSESAAIDDQIWYYSWLKNNLIT